MPSSDLRSRIGVPQVVSLVLLFLFLVQCLWFLAHVPVTAMEGSYIEAGLLQLEHLSDATSPTRSPLLPLIAGFAARFSGAEKNLSHLNDYRFTLRLPFLLTGLLLGASVWYVARRLYGNVGGYIALGLYCFSPVMVAASSQIGPEIIGTWGAFGLIFTAIAVAHTLYAPREVLLWNWRRILLMGLSIAICVGAGFSLWILLVPALLFLLWVGHVRRSAALSIYVSACLVGLLLLWATYGFRPRVFGFALRHAEWLGAASDLSWHAVGSEFGSFFLQNGIGLVLLLAIALVTFLLWPRVRFFGTLAPLIVGVMLVGVALWMRTDLNAPLLVALPFLILFMAGISADLLESRHALAANAVVGGVLVANAMLDVYGLLYLTRTR